MAWTTSGGLANRNSIYVSIPSRREKEAKPSSDSSHAYKSYRRFKVQLVLEISSYDSLDSSFPEKCPRKGKSVGELTATELTAAHMYWVRVVQEQAFIADVQSLRNNLPLPRGSKISRFNPFLRDGLVRLGSRLQCADLTREQRHPLLLDGAHRFTELLILQTHIRLHHFVVRIILSQLRNEFWVLRARHAIKRVIHTCLVCKTMKNPRGQQIEALLPSGRVKPSRPFAVTGIDFAGPLYIKVGNGMHKAYITLFTCATTRAVHLEL